MHYTYFYYRSHLVFTTKLGGLNFGMGRKWMKCFRFLLTPLFMNLGITFQLLICILIEVALHDILQKIPEYSCKDPNFDSINWKRIFKHDLLASFLEQFPYLNLIDTIGCSQHDFTNYEFQFLIFVYFFNLWINTDKCFKNRLNKNPLYSNWSK